MNHHSLQVFIPLRFYIMSDKYIPGGSKIEITAPHGTWLSPAGGSSHGAIALNSQPEALVSLAPSSAQMPGWPSQLHAMPLGIQYGKSHTARRAADLHILHTVHLGSNAEHRRVHYGHLRSQAAQLAFPAVRLCVTGSAVERC